jgi:hypothetical protein
VLIALIDPAHIWFMTTGAASWATCPMTENGVLRIVGDPKYPNSVGSPAACAPILAGLVGLPGHVFWADAISLRQDGLVDVAQIMTPGQVTVVICWRWRFLMVGSWRRLTGGFRSRRCAAGVRGCV